MARGQGANAALNMAFESTYGTPPASGFLTLPFVSSGLGTEQPLLDSEILGLGRDPAAPQRDAITSDGDIVIPLGLNDVGHWLKALFGAPTTTGSGPKVHTFASGASALPSMSIEIGNPDVPAFEMFSGVMANTFKVEMKRSGLLQATVGLIAQGSDAISATTNAGTPTAVALTRFGHFNGSIKRDGSTLANVTMANFTYSNGLESVETIRNDGKIDGIDLGIASMKGSLEARFADTTLFTQARDGSACSLEFAWTISASAKLVITAHSVFLPVPRRSIDGPGGISAKFDWQAAKATSPARMVTAVLTNAVTSY